MPDAAKEQHDPSEARGEACFRTGRLRVMELLDGVPSAQTGSRPSRLSRSHGWDAPGPGCRGGACDQSTKSWSGNAAAWRARHAWPWGCPPGVGPGLFTVTGALPVIVLSLVSVAVMVWSPGVIRVVSPRP